MKFIDIHVLSLKVIILLVTSFKESTKALATILKDNRNSIILVLPFTTSAFLLINLNNFATYKYYIDEIKSELKNKKEEIQSIGDNFWYYS